MTFSDRWARAQTRVAEAATSTYGPLVVLATATVLSMADRNFGYFFGLGVVLIVARESGWDWSTLGFGRRLTVRTVLLAAVIAVLLYLVIGVVETFLQLRFGEIDLSSVEDIEGNVVGYGIIMAVMWVFAAFGEELLFQGYYMQGTAKLLGGSTAAWLGAAVLISVYFGVSHGYQGPAGSIAVALAGFSSAMIYVLNRQNLILAAMAHGLYDSIGLTLIYLGKYDALGDWVLSHAR